MAIKKEKEKRTNVKIVGRTVEESEANRKKSQERISLREKEKQKLLDAGATDKAATIEAAGIARDAKEKEEQEKFKVEDVEGLKGQVAAEEASLGPSAIQETETARLEQSEEQKNKFIEQNIKSGLSRKEAELFYDSTFPENEFALKQSQGTKAVGFIRNIFGEVGKDFIGLSLNDFLDQASDPTELSSLTGQMSEAASLLPAIEGVVNNGAISPQKALAELNSAEKDGTILRAKMDRLAVFRPEIVMTEEYLEMRVELEVYLADIRDARGTALERLRTTTPEFNILETQDYINQMGAIKGKK